MTMTSRIRGVALACSLTILGFVTLRAVADDAAIPAAIKAIQGTWATSESDSLDAKWVFKDETMTATVNGMEYAGKIKVDDAAKPHPTLDIELTEGPEDAKGKSAKAIYKLEGEKLVIAVGHPGRDRPKDFEPVPDEVYLFELKKQKKN